MELIKTKKYKTSHATYEVRLYDTGKYDHRGQTILAYELFRLAQRKRELLFKGSDFSGSPMHADDSVATIKALLGFLTLKPGDTDRDYFSGYTKKQLEWCESGEAEELALVARVND